MTTQTSDPLESAMETEYQPRPRVYFGQIDIDSFYCILVKGQGKVLFDPDSHPADHRRTALTITINPLPGSPIENAVKRELIAESEEWAKIIKPSLRAINADLRAVNGKWAQVELAPTGRKYTDKTSGVEKESTTFVFKAVYASEDECLDSANAFFYPDREDLQGRPATPAVANNGNTAEREIALKFLPALWKSAAGDPIKMAEVLAKNPLTSKFFTIESPEVVACMPPF